MKAIYTLYSLLFYQPLLNILIFLYTTIAFGDLGVAIILLTILIRLLLYPVFEKGLRQQAVAQELQPKLKRIREDHKDNPQKQIEATLTLYREYKFNPLSPLILLVIQIPVLIALYQIILASLQKELVGVYGFLSPPAHINTSFLGLINLAERNTLLTGLTAVSQYLQMRLGIKGRRAEVRDPQRERTQERMALLMAGVIFFVFLQLPAAINLYILVTLLFSIFQQMFINRTLHEQWKTGKSSLKK